MLTTNSPSFYSIHSKISTIFGYLDEFDGGIF